MRKGVKEMEVITPVNLAEVLNYLSEEPNTPLLAGGTDLLVKWKEGKANPDRVLNIQKLAELRCIQKDGEKLVFGSLCTHEDISTSQLVWQHAPVLAQACSQVGSPQIRNRGTLGGNLATASPAGDTLPALFVLGGLLTLTSSRGLRQVAVKEFFVGPGKTVLQSDELITEVAIPIMAEGEKGFYRKLGQRKALAISIVSVAVKVKTGAGAIESFSAACGSVGPKVMELTKTAAAIAGCPLAPEELWHRTAGAGEETDPLSDIRASRLYRQEMVRVLLYQGLYDLLLAGQKE